MSKKKYKYTTYLCGSIESISATEATGWRNNLLPKLEHLGIKVLDPCKGEEEKTGYKLARSKELIHEYKEKQQFDIFDIVMDIIICTDLIEVRRSDFLICYLEFDQKMGGTICEIHEAYKHSIPIFAVCYDNPEDMNSWVLREIRTKGKVFPNFKQLIKYLEENIDKLYKRKKKLPSKFLKSHLEIAKEKLLQLQNKKEEVK